MTTITQNKILSEEDNLKEKVYKTFDSMLSKASSEVRIKTDKVKREAYEDQAEFMVHSELSDAKKNKHEVETLISKLYDKPYFSHVEVCFKGDDECEHYFLSDCEGLEETVKIGNDGFILPFKLERNGNRPISKALFHCYQAKKGDPISYKAPGGEIMFIPHLICDTHIVKRKLLNVTQLYPAPKDFQVNADEILEERLQENRDNPTLSNIISTLQLKQFEIIGTDVKESFVVQGCAGSGKSQCLLHRLFFLRDELSQDRWNKVLLLTPTKLFREYSAELMRRYQLSDIYNCSIADLYRRLLNVYDDRFKDRQYVYQMTEEYLPDGYLFAVYEEDNVQRIESEIDKAIQKYVVSGCNALGIGVPEIITADVIDDIVNQLDTQMEAFDVREKALQQRKDYQEKRKEYEQLLKNIESVRKKQKRYQEDLAKNIANQEKLASLIQEVEKTELGKREWVEQRENKIKKAKSKLEIISRKFGRGMNLQVPAQYAKQLFVVKDLTEGERYRSDEEELVIWDELIALAQSELQEATRHKKPKNVIGRYVKRQSEIEDKLAVVATEIEEISHMIVENAKWLQNVTSEYEGQEAKNTLLRSEMQQSRHFLSRIESTVFEQEVWKALAPIKDKFNIQTLEIENLQDGKHKENRILYKSDLLFYIRIYMKLHPNAKLLEYSLICIDEGQDLHRADYDILHGLYPKSVFNVFGDIDQVLHSACGISDWEVEAGIGKVYPLTTNYRNTAAIVDFCNKQFDIKMDYVGDVNKTQKPVVVEDIDQARTIIKTRDVIIIVKDKEAYQELCVELIMEPHIYTYLDTTSDRQGNLEKVCYSIFAAKGLEFKNVFVYAKNMTKNQKVVACTRSMGGLYYYE